WVGVSSVFQRDALPHLDQFEGLIGSSRVLSMRVAVIWFPGKRLESGSSDFRGATKRLIGVQH
ncbi:pentatricopeptide repeat-containing protein, partial [Trifolium medium]|nr:pentatricopeptide repeat-containing protein [Trifolium medium]